MGKLILSWSPISGQGGTTSNIAALAAMYALNSESSALITHTQLAYSSLELLFGKEKVDSIGFDDNGIMALERLSKAGLLKADTVKDYVETIYRGGGKLELLGASSYNDALSSESFMKILQVINDVYDIVWIDVHHDTDKEIVQDLFAESDLIFVNLPQNNYILEQFFNGEEVGNLNGKNIVYLIGEYDDDVNFSIRKIQRKYKIKGPIFPVPYSRAFKDASNNKNLTEMFYYSANTRKDSSLYKYVTALNAINNHVTNSLGLKKFMNRDEVEL